MHFGGQVLTAAMLSGAIMPQAKAPDEGRLDTRCKAGDAWTCFLLQSEKTVVGRLGPLLSALTCPVREWKNRGSGRFTTAT